MKERMLVWFSCGVPSAVAAKRAIERFSGSHEVIVVTCDTRPSEHSDNYRFSKEVERWLAQRITYIHNEKYETVDEVFEKERYMAGVGGARCTTELKKVPRIRFALPDDIHVFGFTVEEQRRIREFTQRNPDLRLKFILSDLSITRENALKEIQEAGIRLPRMYELGFKNNNCPGCVKASSPWYWDKIRTDFPEVFERRCKQSRAIGCRLVEIKHHVRIFLDELPPGPFKEWRGKKKEQLSCGPECASPGIKP
jgi:hypothetical protein